MNRIHLPILFIFVSKLVFADHPCRLQGPNGVIDLSSLGRTDGKAAFPDVRPSIGFNYQYSYNPCKPFSEGGCQNVSVCQVSLDKTYTFTLGTQDSAQWNDGASSGSPSITYSSNSKQAYIELKCATDATNVFEALGENPTNYYRFRLTSKCACWNGCSGIPPPQENCTVNGITYTSDKEVIQSFPFAVAINPLQPAVIPYANVDINGRVINLTLVNIQSIPPALFCLKNLEELSILNSRSVSIPAEISRLSPSLKSLIIANTSNSLNLPPELFTLKQLSSLSIINCGLKAVPDDVGKLTSLVQLTLDQNLLINIPWTIGSLENLSSLSIRNNIGITSIDTLIGAKSLAMLRASKCSINQLPRNISNLQIIELDDNQLRSLDGLETITKSQCSLLSFENNQITSISSASLAQITTLETLSLANNLLVTLPDSLYTMRDLKVLDIRENKFKTKEMEWIQGIFRLTNTTVFV